MSQPPKRRALGRGLSALLPQQEERPEARPASQATRRREYARAQIEEIHPSPDQPRRRFEDAELEELAQSIRTYGVIQPLVVCSREDGGYTLVAGERRWRASQRAGLHEVPVVIQDLDPREAFERALVENIQRSDLNAIEEAEAYRRLVQDFGHTQDEVAARVGKERSTIANSLRLLRLPPAVRELVESRALSMGHARALLALEDEQAIAVAARKVVAEKLSVRAAEALVRAQVDGASAKREGPARVPAKTPAIRDLETRLERALGARVSLRERGRNKSGTIEIRYADLDDLDRLLDRLLGDG
jgi:ParB family transcriptional regulator, chromosome partitioning protein